jgi:ABC-type lipoprotein release transport system permease subunit
VKSFVWSQFRFRRVRVSVLALAVLVAAVSFVLLTGAAKTSSLQVQGTVKSNFRPAYDILVRPQGSKTALERNTGLVRPNYLSGIFGGITLRQYGQIKHLRDVDVAAPIANIGYLSPSVYVPLHLDSLVNKDPFQLYRIKYSYVADRGNSRYPSHTAYVYFTRRDRFMFDNTHGWREIFHGRVIDHRSIELRGAPQGGGPFATYAYLEVFSARSPGSGSDESAPYGPYRPGKVTSASSLSFPMLVAAIDPVQEARLMGLDRAVVSGRYLRESDRPRIAGHSRLLPVVASTRVYVDEALSAVVERLSIPRGANVPRMLDRSSAYYALSRLPGERLKSIVTSPASVYERFLSKHILSNSYWTPGNVRYGSVSQDTVRPLPTANPISIWQSPGQIGGYWAAPGSNRDVQFRRLSEHAGSNEFNGAGILNLPGLQVVGRYDPSELRGFSPLSQVPVETYFPPVLSPADGASKNALNGKPLLPTQNLGGYIQQPPLLLTTLQAARAFSNPRFFSNVRGKGAAPISVIRVRVKGVNGPDPLSLERIKVVAQKIHDETGLDVDITAGSSPHPLLVALPAGKYGRPPLLLREGWSKKGVSVSFLRALDRKDALLFGLILVICGFFLGNGALAAVRARRAEIGVLRTLGWPGRVIFTAILSELALVGLLAGLAGVALALGLVAVLDLHLALWRPLLVLPLSLLLALVAGLLPALLASRGQPLDALRPPVAVRNRLGHVRSLLALAFVNLRRLPARTLLGAAGLFIGVAALTVLAGIERGFHGTLVGTVLGNAISVQVRGADFVAVALTIVLAGLSVADVLYLNLRERSAELATLRAVGWSDRQIATVIVLEGLGLGLLGSVAGALAGFALGWALLGVPPLPLLVAAAIATAGGIVIAVLGSLVPLSQIGRLSPHAVLAAE